MKLNAVLPLLVLPTLLFGKTGSPNILFLYTDDQAPWAVGKWSGHTYAKTPHLDKLFSEGAYLPNSFVVTPVCSPSRAALATGMYGTELGITDWIHPRNEPELGLDPQTTTWYEILQNAGYHTGLVGKWHLGLTDAHHPSKTGFNYFMGHRAGGWSTANPTLEVNGKPQKIEGLTTDILTDNAIKFLNERPKEKPFLLCLHFRAPHTRWLPVADEDWKPFADLDPKVPHPNYPGVDIPRVKKMIREYLASVRGVDRNVGRMLAELDRLGLHDNTVVIFSSDHGYNMGHNGIWHKGNGHWVLKREALPPPPRTYHAVNAPTYSIMPCACRLRYAGQVRSKLDLSCPTPSPQWTGSQLWSKSRKANYLKINLCVVATSFHYYLVNPSNGITTSTQNTPRNISLAHTCEDGALLNGNWSVISLTRVVTNSTIFRKTRKKLTTLLVRKSQITKI